MTKEMIQQLSDILTEKSIRALAQDGETVKLGWDLAFGEAVPEDKRQEVFYGQFRWHLFSYGLLEAKSGDEARAALNEKQSQRLQLFWQEDDAAWEMRSAFDLDADTVDKIAAATGKDLYVFDDEGGWTYALTHEEACGPYFFQW